MPKPIKITCPEPGKIVITNGYAVSTLLKGQPFPRLNRLERRALAYFVSHAR